jgi:hypothetical protein
MNNFSTNLLWILSICLGFLLGFLIGNPSPLNAAIVDRYESEYKKCIYDLPRNKNCRIDSIKFRTVIDK